MKDGQRVEGLDVHLVDNRSEDYVPPPPPAYVAFSGGKTLGKEKSAAMVDQDDDSSVCVFTRDLLSSISSPILDENKPTTVLQVKTLTGKKIKMK